MRPWINPSIVCTFFAAAGWLHCQPTLAQSALPTVIPFYIGTYTNGSSQGIYRSELDTRNGHLAPPQLVAKIVNPSFLTIHPKLPVLYAVSEVAAAGEQVEQLVAYQIRDDGTLQALGGEPQLGDSPCYVATDATGQMALVANYSSGSVTALALQADGRLGEVTARATHQGSSVNRQRQQSAHAHCIVPDPSNRFACVADLGMDQVVVYRLDPAKGSLHDTGRPWQAPAGSGPRHITFHPDGKHAFVIHELSSTLSALSWDAARGQLELLDAQSTLPADFDGSSSTAEVLVHPLGRFVYGSNRGHDSIAGFTFDANSGQLQSIGHTPTRGQTPRNFRVDPTGRFLLAENQGSDTIFVYEIDLQSGSLKPLESSISVGAPCCIKFFVR